MERKKKGNIPSDDGDTEEGGQDAEDQGDDAPGGEAGGQGGRGGVGAGKVEEVDRVAGGVAGGGDVLGFAGGEVVGGD